MMNEKRAHPVVDRFVTTDLDLETIIADLSRATDPVEQALALLSACLDGRRLAKEALAAAQGTPLTDADPELTILLLCRWAELLCRLGRPPEAEALLHRIEGLTLPDTHPTILAEACSARAILADAKGNQGEHEDRLREVLALVPEASPRRKYHVWELGLLLARQGRGTDFKQPLKDLTWQCNERFTADRLLLIQFLDAVETGRIREASSLMPHIAGSRRPQMTSGRIPYAEYQQLLALMHAAVTRQVPRHELVKPDRPIWVQIVFHLLQHNHAEALRWARLEAKRSLNSIFGTGFESFNLIRAELASGNGEAARRLMLLRAARGNRHFMDPLFHARCALLGGNRREAIQQLGDLLPGVDRYAARGRLDFELLMAAELPPGEMLDLMRRAGTRTPTAIGEAPPPEKVATADAGPPRDGLQAILGRSAAIQQIRETIKQLAALDAPVLITGETGTGKELIAKALHMESERRDRPFIPVNCGAIPETLLESELFGYARGAFTGADRAVGGLFADAAGGTLLLDEIGEISPRLQTALLRVLETNEVRAVGSTQPFRVKCRVLAATNADLETRIEAGTFRRDLLYRLQRLCIHIPPLRERREDIMLLARRFLDADRPVGTKTSVSRGFIEALRSYDWPGNVRELRNVIERLRLTHSDKTVYSEDDLDIRPRRSTPHPDPTTAAHPAPGTERRVPIADRRHSVPPDPTGDQRPATGDRHGTPAEPTTGYRSASGDRHASPPDTDALDRLIRGGTSPLRRLDAMRELFAHYGKLTRAELVATLHIAPNTATKYLKTLIEEGTIRRVEPSASTRSHYFEATDADRRP